MALIKNDVKLVYKKIEEGADVNFEFGRAYGSKEKALLRSGADPNYKNHVGDLTLFWAIDGGPEMVKILYEYGADLDARTEKDWTPLSYAKAMGKYGLVDEKGIYPEDVLKYYGATVYGSRSFGVRSPRESYNPAADNFARDRGSYQREPEAP